MLYLAISCYILLGPNNNAKSEFPRFPDGILACYRLPASASTDQRTEDQAANKDQSVNDFWKQLKTKHRVTKRPVGSMRCTIPDVHGCSTV